VRRKHNVRTLAGRAGPERIPTAETVPGDGNLGDLGFLLEVLDRRGDTRVDGLGAVVLQKLLDVPACGIQVGGGGVAGEEVRGDS